MASFADPVTIAIKRSVHTPAGIAAGLVQLTEAEADAGEAFEQRYRILTGTTITEMDAAAKAVVDAAEAAAEILAGQTAAVVLVDAAAPAEAYLDRELFNALAGRVNLLTDRHLELAARVQAMLDSTGGVANLRTDGLAVTVNGITQKDADTLRSEAKTNIAAGGADP